MPGQEAAMRLPVFDIEVRAQRENAYTKMSQNELALQMWNIGILNPQMTDQALIVLDMMDFKGKDELRKKVQEQGTMMDVIQQIGQIAMELAQRYEPAMAQQLAQTLQSVAADLGAQTGGGGGGLKTGLAPDDETKAPHEATENQIVRRAAERSANASRPD